MTTTTTSTHGTAISRARARRRRQHLLAYALLAPAAGVLLIAMAYPVGWQIVTSMREFGLAQQFGQPAPFVGFANYVELLGDQHVWVVIAKSIAFCFVTAAVTIGIGVGFALIMMYATRGARIVLQVSLLLAWSMPVVAAMTVWIWLFDRRRGVINYLLDALPGVEMNRFNWLETPGTFFLVASIIVIWMSVPFVAFSVYAALTQVSGEVLEAAQIDGADGAKQVRYIILPMIRPVMSIVLLLQLIWDLRVFTQIRMLQDASSSAGEFDLLGTYIFKLGTGAQDFGMASAASIVVLAITIAISWFYVRTLLKEDQS